MEEQLRFGCLTALPMPAVHMNRLDDGRRVCGRETDAKFRNAVRATPSGTCPEGLHPCNEGADRENLICLDTSQTECPINGLRVSSRDNLTDTDDDWFTLELDENLVLQYTTTANALPITTFSLSLGTPCLDMNAQVREFFHVFEMSRYD